METSKILLVSIALLFSAASSGEAQNTAVEQEGVVLSRSLSGHVNVGLEKVAGQGITVELCSSDWRTVLVSTKSDNNGYFSFEKPPGKIFYLRLSSTGVNSLQLRVRVDRHAAHDLTIHLSIAT
jgi:hypothetical protein